MRNCWTHEVHDGPPREDIHGPPPCHHPAIGGESVLAVKTRGVDSGGREAVVVVGVDAENGVVGIQQWRRLVEVAVGEERKTSRKGSRKSDSKEGEIKKGNVVLSWKSVVKCKRILEINRKER